MMRRVLVGAWRIGGAMLLSGAMVAGACAQAVTADDKKTTAGGGGGSGGSAGNGGSGGSDSNTGGAGGTGSPSNTTTASSSGGAAGLTSTTSTTSGGAGTGGTGASTNTGGTESSGGSAGAPTSTDGSGGAPADECAEAEDCEPIEGECVVCELTATSFRACVSHGASVCDGAERDACELCDGSDLGDAPVSCAEFGEPGEFSGGSIVCNDTCDGYDTSGCTVCGNDVKDPEEACDGSDIPTANCAALGLPPPAGGDDVDLGCLESCEYDRSGCQLCSVPAEDCLLGDDSDCTGASCSGKQCAAGEVCSMSCGNSQACVELSCNMSATCAATCGEFGVCDETCEPFSECALDCADGYDSKCGLACAAAATCTLECGQPAVSGEDPAACHIECDVGANCSVVAAKHQAAPTGTAYCGAGNDCDYLCRTQSNCSGLNVVCAEGATCNIECIEFGTTCPAVTCEAGSNCRFNCGDNACNAPVCADGAECECIGTFCDFELPE